MIKTTKTIKRMKILTLFFIALISSSLLLFTGCEKNKLPDPVQQEMVTQTFGINIFNSGNIGQKDWVFSDWEWNYNPNEYELTFTPQGEGDPITRMTTIEELKAGFTMELLKGTYTVTYETEDIKSENLFYLNGEINYNINKPVLSEQIDIKINNNNIVINGDHTTLTATINDLLIIVDYPTNHVDLTNTGGPPFYRLIPENYGTATPIDEGYHWGYFRMRDYERGLVENTTGLKLLFGSAVINAKDWELGKVYHVQSKYGDGTINGINIPGFETVNIFIEDL